MKAKTIEELLAELDYCKSLLEHEYRREHRIAPAWLYEKIHLLEDQIRWLKRKEKANESNIYG